MPFGVAVAFTVIAESTDAGFWAVNGALIVIALPIWWIFWRLSGRQWFLATGLLIGGAIWMVHWIFSPLWREKRQFNIAPFSIAFRRFGWDRMAGVRVLQSSKGSSLEIPWRSWAGMAIGRFVPVVCPGGRSGFCQTVLTGFGYGLVRGFVDNCWDCPWHGGIRSLAIPVVEGFEVVVEPGSLAVSMTNRCCSKRRKSARAGDWRRQECRVTTGPRRGDCDVYSPWCVSPNPPIEDVLQQGG